jgi:threonine/homoserine/homoserine lactone efflux protein
MSSKGKNNMRLNFFLRGLVIGFSIAAVVGPIGLLCIQRTLQRGRVYGLVTGMGAATADGIYGCIAAFGLTVITSFLVRQLVWVHLLGGLFLIYLGIKTILTKPAEQAATGGNGNFFAAYFSTLLLTLTNPTTILSFVAIFAGLGVGTIESNSGGAALAALLVVVGVFFGSTLWWCLLTGSVGLLRKRFTRRWLLWVNRVAGMVIMLFGLFAIVGLK